MRILPPELKFLGYIVSADGTRPDPAKVTTVRDWLTPVSVYEVLGLANYFRKQIQRYSSVAAPLTDSVTCSRAYMSRINRVSSFVANRVSSFVMLWWTSRLCAPATSRADRRTGDRRAQGLGSRRRGHAVKHAVLVLCLQAMQRVICSASVTSGCKVCQLLLSLTEPAASAGFCAAMLRAPALGQSPAM